ncbi:ABC transporter permease subunit [Actinomadura madurae]|uniref:ABC transporter permease subunit n=1 Tax=Actinomadura madurae TaxID=1993 RepID=UPI003999EF98
MAAPTRAPSPPDAAPAGGPAPPTRRDRRSAVLLLLPALVALTVLFALPLINVAWQSFTDPTFGIDNYTSLFTDGYTLRVLGRTVLTALVVTFVGMVLAYPYAYAMTIVGPTARAVLVTVVLVPFWTSMLARNFAWLVLMQNDGVIQKYLLAPFGFGDTVLLGTNTGVAISMTQVMLPFMVLPMYSRMQQIDRRLVKAAQGLGAGRVSAFRKVYVPLSLPGVVAGASLVFVLALGFYVTPALLGSPQSALIAQVINTQARELLDFGGAGAMGMFLLVVALAVLGVSRLLAGRGAGGLSQAVATAGGASGASESVRAPWLRAYTAVAGLFLVAPSLVVIPMSFSSGQTFQFPPQGWSVRWYERLFTSPEWTASILNSLQVAVITAVLATVLGTAAAVGLTWAPERVRGAANGFLLSPLTVPHILIALVVFSVFLRMGLNGKLIGIILAHTALALPFVVIAVFTRLRGMDPRLADAAAGMGARPWSVFRRVTLPLAMPGVASGAVLAFVSSLDEVVVALFLQGPAAITLPVQMFNSVALQIDPTISAASSVMVVGVSVPILLAQVAGARRGAAKAGGTGKADGTGKAGDPR